MLLNTTHVTETNCTLATKPFSIKESPIAFEILSSRLYSNPMLAIVRELLTNAYDSHKAAGTLDTPIDIHLPDNMDSTFSIRDYGVGLSKEDVYKLYTTFFSSTKSLTNDFTGCFGLGSKTPFAYTSGFSVQSIYNGKKYYFIAMKKDGYPSVTFIKEEDTDEPNGLFIAIPCKEEDFQKFRDTLEDYLKFIPEIKVKCNRALNINQRIAFKEDGITLYTKSNEDYYSSMFKSVFIKQGQNTYPLVTKLIDNLKLKIIPVLHSNFDLIIEVPIGTLDITPNRETLSIEEVNLAKIRKLLMDVEQRLYDIFTSLAVNNEHKLSTCAMSIYLTCLSNKYFPNSNTQYFKDDNKISNRITFKPVMPGTLYKLAGYLEQPKLTINTGIEADSKHKSLIILVPSNYKNQTVISLYNIINNYDELDYLNIYLYVIPASESLGVRDSNYLPAMRKFHKWINTLNGMEEKYFDISLMTLKQFRKKYPNAKRPKNTVEYKKIISTKTIRCSALKCHKYPSSMNVRGEKASSLQDIDIIKRDYKPENTIILVTTLSCVQVKYIFSDMENILDRKGNVVVNQWFDTKLPNTDEDIYIVNICKTNKRLFKEYQVVTLETMLKEWFAYDWKLNNWSDKRKDTFYYLPDIERMEEIIQQLGKDKRLHTLPTSKIWRKVQLFKTLITKYNNYTLGNLSQWVKPEMLEAKYTQINFSNLLDKDMYTLAQLIKDTRFCYVRYSHINGQVRNPCHQDRYLYQQILAKENKNVLLQR